MNQAIIAGRLLRFSHLFAITSYVTLVMLLGTAAAADAEGLKSITRTQIEALLAEKATRTPAQRKMDSQLVYFAKQNRKEIYAAAATKHKPDVRSDNRGRVLVDIQAVVSQDLLDRITQGGGTVVRHRAVIT